MTRSRPFLRKALLWEHEERFSNGWYRGVVLNILIVDDDALHGRSVRDLLAAHNYSADVVTSGIAGLEALRAAHVAGTPHQVLILDLNIPDLSGVEILSEIQKAGLNCKTIIVSGERELKTVTPILRLGALDYLPKPFDATQLVNSVRNALSRFQLEQENKRMEQEASESARLYRFLLNASPDLIYMLDPNGCFQFVNHHMDGVFGPAVDTLIGKPWTALFKNQPELHDRLKHNFVERRTGSRATLAEEFDFQSALGTQHNLELSAIGLYDRAPSSADKQDHIGTYGVIRDVTESRRTRRQLQQSQQKFYSLFVDSPDAVFISRLEDGQIVERNPTFVSLCRGLGANDDTDQFLWTSDQPRSEFVKALDASPERVEWLIETPTEEGGHSLEVTARSLELEGVACMIATVRDRTAEKQAELDRLNTQRQLQQAGRMEAIGQVAGGIAHDFNNILASIIGYTELVRNRRQGFTEEQIEQYLDEVITAGHRARDLISQMLKFTRAESADIRVIDVTETIDDVSRMLRAAIPSLIELDTRFEEGLPAVNINPTQLQQIIINLLINARDSITGHGRIEVEVIRGHEEPTCRVCEEKIEGEQVVISVSDTGHGILPEIVDKIFEMYFTTRESESGSGTGFGLWMINNLVHEHGGHITLESQIDVGTTFRIHLPAQASKAQLVPLSATPIAKISGRVLVVDDEISVANFIGEVLRDKGYPTVVFTESPKAMSYLQDNPDDVALLLTDGAMPLVSGIELAEFAKSRKPELPIIFITAYSKSQSLQALKKIGVDRHLEKPFSVDQMLSVVSELIAPSEVSTSPAEESS